MSGTRFGLPSRLRTRFYLTALVLSCLVPVCLASVYLVHYSYQNRIALLDQDLLAAANIALAGALIVLSKRLIRIPALYEAPKGKEPPPWPIRALLLLTCSGVSFSHGSNDGQKGMGLIMLILIAFAPASIASSAAS